MTMTTPATPMLVPTASDTVRSIAGQLEEIILPALDGQLERSTVATILHLLRHTSQRLALEGQILFDEIAYLRPLFTRAAGWLAARPDHRALAERMSAAVAVEGWSPDAAPGDYPDLERVAARVAILRQLVDELLGALHQRDATDAEGAELHQAMRAYIGWQIAQEAKLVEPAFRGWGPRR